MPNLLEAHFNASRKKRKRSEVIAFEADLMANIESIRNDLINKTFHTSEYSVFIKYEPNAAKSTNCHTATAWCSGQ